MAFGRWALPGPGRAPVIPSVVCFVHGLSIAVRGLRLGFAFLRQLPLLAFLGHRLLPLVTALPSRRLGLNLPSSRRPKRLLCPLTEPFVCPFSPSTSHKVSRPHTLVLIF